MNIVNDEPQYSFQVVNNGLFFTRFALSYKVGEDTYYSFTNPFPLGGFRRIYFPVNAYIYKACIETEAFIDEWINVFNDSFTTANHCFIAYGISFLPYLREYPCNTSSYLSMSSPLTHDDYNIIYNENVIPFNTKNGIIPNLDPPPHSTCSPFPNSIIVPPVPSNILFNNIKNCSYKTSQTGLIDYDLYDALNKKNCFC